MGSKKKFTKEQCAHELKKLAYNVDEEFYLNIYYDDEDEGVILGKGRADIFVDKTILLELKTQKELTKSDEIQLVNYLNATKVEVGLLINFGQTVTIKRKYRDYTPKK